MPDYSIYGLASPPPVTNYPGSGQPLPPNFLAQALAARKQKRPLFGFPPAAAQVPNPTPGATPQSPTAAPAAPAAAPAPADVTAQGLDAYKQQLNAPDATPPNLTAPAFNAPKQPNQNPLVQGLTLLASALFAKGRNPLAAANTLKNEQAGEQQQEQTYDRKYKESQDAYQRELDSQRLQETAYEDQQAEIDRKRELAEKFYGVAAAQAAAQRRANDLAKWHIEQGQHYNRLDKAAQQRIQETARYHAAEIGVQNNRLVEAVELRRMADATSLARGQLSASTALQISSQRSNLALALEALKEKSAQKLTTERLDVQKALGATGKLLTSYDAVIKAASGPNATPAQQAAAQALLTPDPNTKVTPYDALVQQLQHIGVSMPEQEDVQDVASVRDELLNAYLTGGDPSAVAASYGLGGAPGGTGNGVNIIVNPGQAGTQPGAGPQGASNYGADALQNLWIANGGSPQVAPLMAQVFLNESGGNPSPANGPPGLVGLAQINAAAHPEFAGWDLKNPYINMQAAVQLYNKYGLQPWQDSKDKGAFGGWGRWLAQQGVTPGGTPPNGQPAAAPPTVTRNVKRTPPVVAKPPAKPPVVHTPQQVAAAAVDEYKRNYAGQTFDAAWGAISNIMRQHHETPQNMQAAEAALRQYVAQANQQQQGQQEIAARAQAIMQQNPGMPQQRATQIAQQVGATKPTPPTPPKPMDPRLLARQALATGRFPPEQVVMTLQAPPYNLPPQIAQRIVAAVQQQVQARPAAPAAPAAPEPPRSTTYPGAVAGF